MVQRKAARPRAAPAQWGIKAGTSKEAATERRVLFVEAYIANGGNGKQAAIAVGFSPHTAEQQASRLLRDVKVQAALAERRGELRAKFRFESEDISRSLSQALHCDPRKFFNADGTLKAIHELDDDTAMGLASFECVELVAIPRSRYDEICAAREEAGAKDAARSEAARRGGKNKDEDPAPARLALYTSKVKLLDKNTAREQGMKHFGLYKTANAQRGHAAVLEMLQIVGPNAARFEVKP